jgi:hypothetical protein
MRHVSYARTPSPHTRRETVRVDSNTICNTPSTPRPVVLTPDSFLGSLSSPQTNTGLLCALCPQSCAPEKTSRSVTHPKIDLGQTRLTYRFFRDRLPKNKIYLVGMSILSILLSLGPGYHMVSGDGGDTRVSCTH